MVDPYGPQALALLREATARLELGKTTLKDIAPHLYVPGPDKLEWKDALAIANRQFADDPIKRAVFLRRYLREGQPAADLVELGAEQIGGFPGRGGIIADRIALYDKATADLRDRMLREHAAKRDPDGADEPEGLPQPTLTITFERTWGDDFADFLPDSGRGVVPKRVGQPVKSELFGEPLIEFRDLEIRGALFGEVRFGQSDRVVHFLFRRRSPELRVEFTIIATLYEHGPSHLIIIRRTDGDCDDVEWRWHGSDLTLAGRDVIREDSWEPLYRESFYKGHLYLREHYRRAADRNEVVRTERFRMPTPELQRGFLEYQERLKKRSEEF